MRIFTYAFLFAFIVFVIAVGFFTLTAPSVPQQTITRTLDPTAAFAVPAVTSAPVAVPPPVSSSTPVQSQMPATETSAPTAAPNDQE